MPCLTRLGVRRSRRHPPYDAVVAHGAEAQALVTENRGVIRDVDEIGCTELGVQALGTTPLKTEKLGVGQRDVSIAFGGVTIAPGDYIYADNNGVIVSKNPLL